MSALRRRAAFALFVGALASAPRPASAAITFEIVNLDGPGEGLNDASPWSPRGGNSATTLGAARLRALEFATAVWSDQLDSQVNVRIGVSFDPLGGTSDAAILGTGGPDSFFRDFAGAPRAATWYPSALADRLAGIDLAPGDADLLLLFNSDVDGPVVLGADGFDYGLAAADAADSWFVQVAVHELAHGLGFVSGVSRASGSKFLGYDDAYMAHVVRFGASPEAFPEMSNAQRVAALVAGAELQWAGAGGVAASGLLSDGASPEGRIELYAPGPTPSSASMTHFAIDLAPDQIEEPFYMASDPDFRLTRAVLLDVGWGAAPACATVDLP